MKVLIAGAGKMGLAYYQVLKAMGHEMTVVGRGKASAEKFREATGLSVVVGGLDSLGDRLSSFEAAIVAVPIETLAVTAMKIVEAGIPRILLEKPGAAQPSDLSGLQSACEKQGSYLRLAYNRRFYDGVQVCRKIISEDGGALGFHFEFGEDVEKLEKARTPVVLSRTVYNHSCHLIDLAFQLGGLPEQIQCFHSGSFPWHPSSAMGGAGRTVQGCLFSYQTDWRSIARWKLDLWTARRRFLFSPLEKPTMNLNDGSGFQPVAQESPSDINFKPGLWKMLTAFFDQPESASLCTLQEQMQMASLCYQIADYPLEELSAKS